MSIECYCLPDISSSSFLAREIIFIYSKSMKDNKVFL